MKKIALTFDLELWHESSWIKKNIPANFLIKDLLIESVDPLIKILKNKGYTATFFVTDEVLDKYPDLIKRLSIEGHEIGSHNFSHQKIFELEKNTAEEKFKQHIEKIKNITGKQPKGFRAPHFSLNNETKWFLTLLKKNNLIYDSSIFPCKTPAYGSNLAPLEPYKIDFSNIYTVNQNSTIIEIPPAVFPINKFRLPLAGGVYFRLFPLKIFTILLKKTPFPFPVLYLHPHELCAQTPKISGPWLKTYFKYFGINKSLKKFEQLSNHFIFQSIEKIFNL